MSEKEDNDGTGGISMVSTGGATTPTGNSSSNGKAALQKMKDANAKYKNLLKMAKERIQQQDDELKRLRGEVEHHKQKLEAEEREAVSMMGMDDGELVGDAATAENSCNIVRVCQRIQVGLEPHEVNVKGGKDEIWALIEFEIFNADQQQQQQQHQQQYSNTMMMDNMEPSKKLKKWKRFDTENDLSDFIRRDTGEPLSLPPYSLTPEQSERIQEEAKQSVAQITEEFRRFRVRSEMARKQADAQIRDLHTSNVETAKRRIEGNDVEKELKQARSEHSQLERIRAEMAQQEAHWKEAYDVLLAENNALKSSGSEALLASQWRQRYESCFKEKEDLENKLKMQQQKAETEDAGKYEMKYRDLKESFRLYRKKAKEIFEAQQQQAGGDHRLLQFTDRSTEDAKLSYLKNLMVNYLTSDIAVREHMESAIGTVLQFTPDDISKIEKKKAEGDYWGLF